MSTRSTNFVDRALNRVLSPRVRPQTLVALRWYDQPKRVTSGPDRLVALWIALEALMGPNSSHRQLVQKTPEHLAPKSYGPGSPPAQIADALGQHHIRRARNDIIHRGLRHTPWPVATDPARRDWPQILNDIVEKTLRRRFHATPTTTLRKHVEEGVQLARTPHRPVVED